MFGAQQTIPSTTAFVPISSFVRFETVGVSFADARASVPGRAADRAGHFGAIASDRRNSRNFISKRACFGSSKVNKT